VVSATLAISDLMLILLTSAFWVGGGIVFIGVLGLGAIGGLAMAARHWWRMR
jgi:hypothetical protein